MATSTISTQHFSEMFSFLAHFNSLVLWVMSPDYQKQLYVSGGYEHIWQRPRQQLYDNPDTFITTLVPDDQQRIAHSIKFRVKPYFKHETSIYQIAKPNGVIQCIRDKCFTLTSGGKNVAIAGIGECIPHGEYDAYLKNEHPEYDQHPTVTDDILGVLLQEYALAIEKESQPKKTKQHNPRTIHIDDQTITLTPREYQCVHHLLNGMSAKQTAYEMNLSQRTIEAYLNNIRDKTNCRNKIVLVNQIRKYNPQLS